MKKTQYLGILLLLIAFLTLFSGVIENLVYIWINDGNYSHGFLVPIVAAHIVWRKRRYISAIYIETYYPVIILLIFACLLFLAGQITIHSFSKHFSMILVILSLLLLIYGWGIFKEIFFSISLLFFMFPLPEIVKRKLTGPLQIFSSYISIEIMNFFNFPAFREGNIIEIPGVVLSIDEACSGLRSVVALLFLALISGYYLLKRNKYRILLTLVSVPVAIILNIIRIVGTAVMVRYVSKNAAFGFYHQFSGIVIFCSSSIIIGCILVYLLKRETKSSDGQKDLQVNYKRGSEVSTTAVFIAITILVFSLFYKEYIEAIKPNTQADLRDIPLIFEKYSGREIKIAKEITKMSNVTRDINILYKDKDELPISLYIGYYRTGGELKGFFHGADVCLPGAGWEIKKKEKIKIKEFINLEILKYVAEKTGRTQILFTWVQAGDITGTEGRCFRIKYALDTIINRRYNDATKIMINTEIDKNETEAQAFIRLKNFIVSVYPILYSQVFNPKVFVDSKKAGLIK